MTIKEFLKKITNQKNKCKTKEAKLAMLKMNEKYQYKRMIFKSYNA